jgi:hypothetical protein
MKKPTTKTAVDNAWDLDPSDARTQAQIEQRFDEAYAAHTAESQAKETRQSAQGTQDYEPLFDLEGLMTDFPTAKELERFVFDRTGKALDLKGRSNKFKYQTALDILNGHEVPEYLFAKENPYLDKSDIIPEDPMKEVPARPADIAGAYMVTQFHSRTFPHPDDEFKAQGQKCDVVFRKYTNNVITYEILGPIAKRAVGTRINKFGQEVPEKYVWVDPRTGEQVIRTESGMLTPLGTRLKSFMQKHRVNKTTIWDAWIDREFIFTGDGATGLDNPWG